jgi:hypothetical protein
MSVVSCPAAVRLALVALVATSAGCAFDSPVMVRFSSASPVEVTESLAPEQTAHRVHGRTTRAAEIVRIDCSTTISYDVREATGTAVLTQTYVVHLRTRRLPRGTAYELDCTGPAILELPADASAVRARSIDALGQEVPLPVQDPVASVPLASGRRLRSEPGMQLAVVRWPHTLPRGDYRVELSFALPEARAIREKALVTASVSCGRSTYVQPILPAVTRMARVRAFTIRPSADPIAFPLPHVAPGIAASAETTRTLSCR